MQRENQYENTRNENLTYTQRLQLKNCLDAGLTKQAIADSLGIGIATVYKEIQRGKVNNDYCPDFAQEKYERSKRAKGPKEKLSIDDKLAQQIADLILKENISPEKAIMRLRSQNIECPTKTTIYAAIDKGLIPNVTRDDLHNKTTTMFSHGLVQIPAWIRIKLNLQDGDVIDIYLQDDKIILKKNLQT